MVVLLEKYDALEKESNRHYEQTKANYEDVIAEKDTCIMVQRKVMDDYDAKLYILSANDGRIPCSQILKLNLDDIFRMKAKKRGSGKSEKVMTCEVPSSELTNVDMIRCGVCLQVMTCEVPSCELTNVDMIRCGVCLQVMTCEVPSCELANVDMIRCGVCLQVMTCEVPSCELANVDMIRCSLCLQMMTCEVPSCELANVDMIRCSVCLNFTCEQCDNVQVKQVKQVMEKCSRIYFVCNNCNEGDFVRNPVTEKMKSVGTESNEIHTNFTISVDKKIAQLESKLEYLINKKLDEKMEAINNFSESIKSQNDTLSKFSQTYSDCAKKNPFQPQNLV